MIAAAVVLTVLQRQPPRWADRRVARETKAAQLATIAEAIAAASPTAERAAYLLAIGYAESRWCLAVGSGAKRGGSGEGYWQLEGAHHAAGARSGLSLEETGSAARLASYAVAHSQQCGGYPAAVLTAYAGRPCAQAIPYCAYWERGCLVIWGWPTLEDRIDGYWRALSALRRGQ